LWLGGVLALTRLPRTPLSGAIWALAVCTALWAVGDLITGLAQNLFWEQIGVAVLYSGAIFVGPVWWILALRWAEDRGVAPPLDIQRWSRVPLAFAFCVWLAMLSNPWHGLFLEPVIGARNHYGPFWWLMSFPSWALILGAAAVELRVLRRIHSRTIRRQGAFAIAASGVVLGANLAYVSGAGPHENVTLPVLTAAAVILVIGMVRQGLYGVLPVALPVIASSDPDGLLVVQPDGRLVHANPRARELLQTLAVTTCARIPAALAPRLREQDGTPVDRSNPDWEDRWWEGVLASGGALYRYDRDDAMPWLRMSAQPVHGRRERLLARCLRIHDATDEQSAEIELHRARRLESVAQLSRGVAHDFNNLLTVARGNAELLLDRLPATPEVQRKLHKILRSCEQAGDLADQLQLYAGAVSPTRRPVDLSELARDTFEMLDSDVLTAPVDRSVDVELDHTVDPLLIEADPTQLRQLLLNLFVNARDALDERGGEIHVCTGRSRLDPARARHLVLGRDRPAAAYAYLTVSDTGAGMDPATQERIFEPFFSTKGKHRGIGLATVFGIVSSHNALLELESSVGRGTVFSVYFPIAEQDGTSAS
jgi:signal transduction histidine kinase